MTPFPAGGNAASRQGKHRNAARAFAAPLLALLLFWTANGIGVWWLGATEFASDAFYDGCAGIVTLALPSLLAGLIVGWGVRDRALLVAATTFGTLGVVGLLFPLWRVPLVSPHSAHSGAMHYLLHNPIVPVTFGMLGTWAAEQFQLGRWTLADKTPTLPPGD